MRDEALAKIRQAKIRRLEHIEIQIASAGDMHAPVELLNEREDLRREVGIVGAVADGAIDDSTRRLLRRYDQADLNLNVMTNLVQRVTRIEEWTAADHGERSRRQLYLNLWLGAMTILLLAQLLGRWL
jgi:hypothetical protein